MSREYADKSVLIVDDAHFIRYKIKKYIQPLKFSRIYEAENGLEALELYRKHEPDLMLMDIIMHDMNGIRTMEKLMAEYPEALVIVISAIDIPEFLTECIDRGIADFVVKPFAQDDLLQAIENVMSPESLS